MAIRTGWTIDQVKALKPREIVTILEELESG